MGCISDPCKSMVGAELRAARKRGGALVVAAILCVSAGCGRVRSDRVEWPVMGTVAAVQTRGEHLGRDKTSAAAVATALSVTKDVERLLNAHNPDSELSRLASRTEREALDLCDRDAGADPALKTRPCYEAAFKLMKASGGAFNPRWRGPGTLDLGAIAKGFAADVVCDSCRGGVEVDMLVDLGGNLKSLRGAWRTGVKSPSGDGFAAKVELREGEALATSATYYRGSHIYDGRTGRAVANGVASVTVLCGSAMWADGLSTTLFVLGPDDGREFLDKHLVELVGDEKVAVLWILSDGRRVKVDDGDRFAE